MKGITPVLRDWAQRRSLSFAKASTILYYKGKRGGGVGGALIPRTIAIRLPLVHVSLELPSGKAFFFFSGLIRIFLLNASHSPRAYFHVDTTSRADDDEKPGGGLVPSSGGKQAAGTTAFSSQCGGAASLPQSGLWPHSTWLWLLSMSVDLPGLVTDQSSPGTSRVKLASPRKDSAVL